jgi:succinate dehydrogenase / fumarate reductase membrane anchor subunit
MSKPSLRTPLGKVRGLGAAHSGTEHFITQRVSAIALAFLAPWLVISFALGLRGGYEGAVAFVAQPLNAVLLILFLGAAFYHMRLGMQVVIEDYIHKHGTKALLLIANTFVCIAGAAVGIFAVLKISLGS